MPPVEHQKLTSPELPSASRERLLADLARSATVTDTMLLDQIARLDNAKREARVEKLTWAIAIMTALNVLLVGYSIGHSFGWF